MQSLPSGTIVTDPNILAQLNNSDNNNPASTGYLSAQNMQSAPSGMVVTDPEVLAQLNGEGQADQELNSAANIGGEVAGATELPLVAGMKLGQSIYNIIPDIDEITGNHFPSWSPSNASMSNAVGEITGVQPLGNPWFKDTADILAAMTPGAGESELLGNALAHGPEALSTIGRFVGGTMIPQAALGAGFNPNNPLSGALIGGLGSLVSAPAALAKGGLNRWAANLVPTNLTNQGVNELSNSASQIANTAQKGYEGLNSISEIPLSLGSNALNAGGKWSNVLNSPDALEMLQSNPGAMEKQFPGITQEYQNSSGPNAIRSMFDPEWLNDFEDKSVGFAPSSQVRKSFNALTENPTLGNADNFKQALNSVSNPTGNQIGLINDGKNSIRNLIGNTLQNSNPEVAANYLAADPNYAVSQQIYKSTNPFNNLTRGTTLDNSPQNVLNILKPVIENSQEISPELAQTPYGQLYNQHINSIKNIYSGIQNAIDQGNARANSFLGNKLAFAQRHHLANILAPGIRTAFQSVNTLNN